MNTLNNYENNAKEMWKTINKFTNKSSKTTLIFKTQQENQILTNKHEIAETLNPHVVMSDRNLLEVYHTAIELWNRT